MIKVSVFYPSGPETHFDMDYYCSRHIPLVRELCGAALKGTAVEKGITGATEGSAPRFAAMGHLLFDSVETYQSSIGPHLEQIVSDIPNYTNIQPIIQISEVMM